MHIGRQTTSPEDQRKKDWTYNVQIMCNDPDLDDGSIELAEYATHAEARRVAQRVARATNLPLKDPYQDNIGDKET